MRMLVLSLLFVLLLASSALAWDARTHEWLAGKACDSLGCGDCRAAMLNGSTTPDSIFHDTINHHCYNTSWQCPEGEWACPQSDNCPALEKTWLWLVNATTLSGCEKYYAIGVASHYFFDNKVFFHKVKNESQSCHSGFESAVGSAIDEGTFTVSRCGATVTSSDFDGWLAEFLNSTGTPTLAQQNKNAEAGFPLTYLIMALVVLLALALLFARRR